MQPPILDRKDQFKYISYALKKTKRSESPTFQSVQTTPIFKSYSPPQKNVQSITFNTEPKGHVKVPILKTELRLQKNDIEKAACDFVLSSKYQNEMNKALNEMKQYLTEIQQIGGVVPLSAVLKYQNPLNFDNFYWFLDLLTRKYHRINKDKQLILIMKIVQRAQEALAAVDSNGQKFLMQNLIEILDQIMLVNLQ